ncbi:MAG: hypothetical protein ACRD0U_07660 [Acidimicrobiales bacterium]
MLGEASAECGSDEREKRRSLRKVRNLAAQLGLIAPVSKLIRPAFGIWVPPAA